MAQKKPSERIREIVLKNTEAAFSSLGPAVRSFYEDQALKDPQFVLPAILQHLDEVHESSAKGDRQP